MIGFNKCSVLALAMSASLSSATHAAEALGSVTYACDSGQAIVVHYDDSTAAAPTASLDYKGRSFDMYNVPTQSGRRFATEQGLTPERGLQWMTTDDGAVLSEMLMDHTAPQPTPIETCKPAS